MIKFRLPKISSLNLGADFDPRNPDFARSTPKKDLPTARFYPYTSTNFAISMYNYSRKFNDGPENPMMMGLNSQIASYVS